METGGGSGILQIKRYEELEFTDDFMFGKVLCHNIDLCRELLELLLQKKIRELRYSEAQKTIGMTKDAKGVRFDVYTEDDENSVYDIEMQMAKRGDLAKRSRYYHGMLDLNLLERVLCKAKGNLCDLHLQI